MIARVANLFPASREDSFEAERVPRLSPVASEELASRKRCSRNRRVSFGNSSLPGPSDPLENASTCKNVERISPRNEERHFLLGAITLGSINDNEDTR